MAQIHQTKSRQAVVFSGSGCGCTDVYSVGVMKALVEGGVWSDGATFGPSIYSGSAFGAFNAAVMVSKAGDDTSATVRYLEHAWLDGLCSTVDRANGVFRIRANPLTWLEPSTWFNNPATAIVVHAAVGCSVAATCTRRREHHEDKQQPAGGRRHHEEIRCHKLVNVIGQERPPGLGWRSTPPNEVFRDAGLADLDAELQQFAVNAWSTPKRVRCDIVWINGRTSDCTAGRPSR